MKKLNYFLTFVAGTMVLASCSNDKDVVVSPSDNAVQQIVLQVASNGDGLTTRAGRPLLSDEPDQNIQKVDLYIVSNTTNKVVFIPPVEWSSATPYENGKQVAITLKGANQLTAGETYTLFALGYATGTEYSTPRFTTESNKTDLENYKLQFTSSTNKSEEIFAGSVEFTVGPTGNFSKSIVLHRQVAGAYFYVYNLPKLEDLQLNCKIQLVASDNNDQIVLGKFQDYDHTYPAGTKTMYVVNGIKSDNCEGGETVICEETISNWYTALDDSNNDGIVDIAGWKDTKTTGRTGGYVKGSIFSSSFVMPFKNTGSQTLKLQIVKQDNSMIHSWNVNMKEDGLIKDGKELWEYSSNTFTKSTPEEDIHKYSIVRNHLYSVGTKSKVNPKNPTDPNNPDPDEPTDEEKPVDISKVQNLTLNVNHNWEVIYKMELE